MAYVGTTVQSLSVYITEEAKMHLSNFGIEAMAKCIVAPIILVILIIECMAERAAKLRAITQYIQTDTA